MVRWNTISAEEYVRVQGCDDGTPHGPGVKRHGLRVTLSQERFDLTSDGLSVAEHRGCVHD